MEGMSIQNTLIWLFIRNREADEELSFGNSGYSVSFGTNSGNPAWLWSGKQPQKSNPVVVIYKVSQKSEHTGNLIKYIFTYTD